MGWLSNGTVQRINPDFQGATIWSQDQIASIKIIASRHDFHDEDLALAIADCVNLDGYNSMRADLNMDSNKLTNLAAGTASGDGVNKTQMDAVDAKTDTNATNIAANAADIATNAGDIATNATAIGNNATAISNNASDITDLQNKRDYIADTFKSNGSIRHLSIAHSGTSTINTANGNRHKLANSGALNLTITKPTGADAALGENYEVEGNILVTNNAGGGGAITLVGVSASDILGVQPNDADAKYLLTYIIHRSSGDAYDELYVWSAV